MKSIKPIRTKSDYKAALKRIDHLIQQNPRKGSEEFDELDVLGTLVYVYEELHYPIQAPNPVDTMKHLMEEKGLKPKDLIPYFGSKGNVSEFLNRKRGLSVRIIKALHRDFRIPFEILLA
jgi:HTH-type transcriptional regulator/antitoxin HigA